MHTKDQLPESEAHVFCYFSFKEWGKVIIQYLKLQNLQACILSARAFIHYQFNKWDRVSGGQFWQGPYHIAVGQKAESKAWQRKGSDNLLILLLIFSHPKLVAYVTYSLKQNNRKHDWTVLQVICTVQRGYKYKGLFVWVYNVKVSKFGSMPQNRSTHYTGFARNVPTTHPPPHIKWVIS